MPVIFWIFLASANEQGLCACKLQYMSQETLQNLTNSAENLHKFCADFVKLSCSYPQNCSTTVRDTENLPFSADTPRRFSEGSRAAIHGPPCGNSRIISAAMRGHSEDLEEVRRWTRKLTHSIENGYWLLKQHPCSDTAANGLSPLVSHFVIRTLLHT